MPDIISTLGKTFESRLAIAHGIDLVAGLLDDPNHQFAERLVIVDDEYPRVFVHTGDLLACGSDAIIARLALDRIGLLIDAAHDKQSVAGTELRLRLTPSGNPSSSRVS
jgi:hypothetical protein